MGDRAAGRPRTIDPHEVSLVALRLFTDRGYAAVSMDEIAVAAGVSRRHLFQLFASKAALVWGGSEEFAVRHRRAREATDPSVPALHALVGAYREAATFPPEAVAITRQRLRVIAANPAVQPSWPPTPGTRGLSLFLVPSTRESGARNGVTALRLERKLGLHGSPTLTRR